MKNQLQIHVDLQIQMYNVYTRTTCICFPVKIIRVIEWDMRVIRMSIPTPLCLSMRFLTNSQLVSLNSHSTLQKFL